MEAEGLVRRRILEIEDYKSLKIVLLIYFLVLFADMSWGFICKIWQIIFQQCRRVENIFVEWCLQYYIVFFYMKIGNSVLFIQLNSMCCYGPLLLSNCCSYERPFRLSRSPLFLLPLSIISILPQKYDPDLKYTICNFLMLFLTI